MPNLVRSSTTTARAREGFTGFLREMLGSLDGEGLVGDQLLQPPVRVFERLEPPRLP